MKIFVLITGGRTGSGFLHSILDGHSQICQLPGEFFFDEFFENVKTQKSSLKIASLFCKEYKYFFDSRHNKFERFNKLGEKKNEYFLINKNKFIKYFQKFYITKKNTKLNLLTNIHLAYSAANGEILHKKKILLLHLHHIYRLKKLEGLNYEILYTVRDPKTNLASFFTSWKRYRKKLIDPWSYFFNMKRLINGLHELKLYKKKIHIIKLEDMHHKNRMIINKLCKISKIKFEKIMNYATFHKKKWWGDMAMKNYLNGADKNFKNKIDINLFFNKDIFFIERAMKNFMINQDYSFFPKKRIYNYFFLILPFKMEIMIFMFNLKNFFFKGILLSLYFYIKRVLLFIVLDFRQITTKRIIN